MITPLSILKQVAQYVLDTGKEEQLDEMILSALESAGVPEMYGDVMSRLDEFTSDTSDWGYGKPTTRDLMNTIIHTEHDPDGLAVGYLDAGCLTVGDLKLLLDDVDPHTRVVFAYESGDYWKSVVAKRTLTLDTRRVRWDEYHNKLRPVTDESDCGITVMVIQ